MLCSIHRRLIWSTLRRDTVPGSFVISAETIRETRAHITAERVNLICATIAMDHSNRAIAWKATMIWYPVSNRVRCTLRLQLDWSRRVRDIAMDSYAISAGAVS